MRKKSNFSLFLSCFLFFIPYLLIGQNSSYYDLENIFFPGPPEGVQSVYRFKVDNNFLKFQYASYYPTGGDPYPSNFNDLLHVDYSGKLFVNKLLSAEDNTYYLELDNASTSIKSAGSVVSSKFVDLSNSAFYLDPAATALSLAIAGEGHMTRFADTDNTNYFLDPASNYVSLLTNGSVGIGTTYIPADYKLAVNGKMIATEVLVELNTQWPDYVFAEDYTLISISELADFIRSNNHLPKIQSAKNLENGAINIAEMQTLQLEKIEELSLYIIQLYNQNEDLKARVDSLESKLQNIYLNCK